MSSRSLHSVILQCHLPKALNPFLKLNEDTNVVCASITKVLGIIFDNALQNELFIRTLLPVFISIYTLVDLWISHGFIWYHYPRTLLFQS